MTDFLRVLYEGVIDFSPNEVMGALMVGLALSLACHGVCILGRKRATNPLPLLCGLIFVVSMLSMAVGFGHSKYQSIARNETVARRKLDSGYPRDPGGTSRQHDQRGRPRGRSEFNPMGRTLLAMADSDKDGHLTPEEAARFVKEADQDGNGSVDVFEIDRVQARPINHGLVN